MDWDTAATTVVSTLDVPTQTARVGAADLDGDGDGDLILVLAGAPAVVRAAHGDGAGTFVLTPGQLELPFDLPDGGWPGFDAADLLPAAGEEVVLGADTAEGVVAVGAGGPTPTSLWSPPAPPSTTDLAVLDRDDDGLPDLFAARPNIAPAVLFRGVDPGLFDTFGGSEYGEVDHDGPQKVAAARSGTGPDVAFAVWRYGSETVVVRHSTEPAASSFSGLYGDYASGIAGIDGDDVEPARFVMWGPDGVVVVAASVPRGANGCREATVDPGAPPLWVAPFSGQGGGGLDLAVLRDTAPPSVLLVRR